MGTPQDQENINRPGPEGEDRYRSVVPKAPEEVTAALSRPGQADRAQGGIPGR